MVRSRPRPRPLLIGALTAVLIAVPAFAQYSEGYNFLKAVRERDGTKTTEMLGPGKAGTVIDTRDQAGEGALHIVTRRRDDQWLSFLLGRGANPNVRDGGGNTPLTIASQIGFVDGAQTLIRRRAQVDLANGAGETPLILAVQNRDLAMVRVLIAAGADPDRADSAAGMSARDYAQRDGRSAAILRVIDAPREEPEVRHRPIAGPN